MAVEDDKLRVRYDQDITAAMERNQKLRDSDEYTKEGIKREFWHVAHIPDSICLTMITEDGFNPYSARAADLVAFLRRNRDKYSKIFTTSGRI